MHPSRSSSTGCDTFSNLNPTFQVPESALFTNIIADVRNNKCDEAYAYIADVLRYGVIVYSWKEDRSWRISHNFFYPDPIACRYKLDNITFRLVTLNSEHYTFKFDFMKKKLFYDARDVQETIYS